MCIVCQTALARDACQVLPPLRTLVETHQVACVVPFEPVAREAML